jgi:hypothetical protein
VTDVLRNIHAHDLARRECGSKQACHDRVAGWLRRIKMVRTVVSRRIDKTKEELVAGPLSSHS